MSIIPINMADSSRVHITVNEDDILAFNSAHGDGISNDGLHSLSKNFDRRTTSAAVRCKLTRIKRQPLIAPRDGMICFCVSFPCFCHPDRTGLYSPRTNANSEGDAPTYIVRYSVSYQTMN